MLHLRVWAVVAGDDGAVAWGSPKKKLGTEGPRGMAGSAVGSGFGAGGAADVFYI